VEGALKTKKRWKNHNLQWYNLLKTLSFEKCLGKTTQLPTPGTAKFQMPFPWELDDQSPPPICCDALLSLCRSFAQT
jgi:hypothetical protein